MILLTDDHHAILDGAAQEPIQGALIETLLRTYGEFPGLVDCYTTDSGAALCRQGSELTLAGKSCDTAELIAFARMMGATRLNCLATSVGGPIPGDVTLQRRQVLIYPHGTCPAPLWRPDDEPNTRRVFEIVKVGSAPNFDHADLTAFVTDIGRRRYYDLAKVFTVADAATAGVYATGATHATIACVATLPEYRGRGYGKAAVTACVRHCLRIGRTPALVAEDADVVGFYTAMGFVPFGECLTLIF